MPSSPECTICCDLREHLVEARKLYTAAVAALDKAHLREDGAVNDRVEAARLIYLKARSNLLEHEGEHGCGSRSAVP